MGTETFKLSAVGDIMLGDIPPSYGFGVMSMMNKYGHHHPFAKINRVLKNTDLLFGNLEAVLSNSNRHRWLLSSKYLRGAPQYTPILKNCGFEVMSIANNHMMQHGVTAFNETVENLKRQNIFPLGISCNENYSTMPYITQIKDIKIGFLGYSFRPEEYHPRKTKYAIGKRQKIIHDVGVLKKKVDLVVLSLHWGDEFIQKPSPYQQFLARLFIDKGANVILGHHPHVLQGIESYSDGLIAYSLGNFVFDMFTPGTRDSMILEIIFNKTKVVNFQVIPVKINKLYQPELLNDFEKVQFLKKIAKLSSCITEYHYTEKQYGDKLKNVIMKAEQL